MSMPSKRYQFKNPIVGDKRAMVRYQAADRVFSDSCAYVSAGARGGPGLGYEIAHDPNPLTTICRWSGRQCLLPGQLTWH
jgi:hypothetical protein